jgi:hypothetical protein
MPHELNISRTGGWELAIVGLVVRAMDRFPDATFLGKVLIHYVKAC